MDCRSNKCVDFICFRLANVDFKHKRSRNRVENIHLKIPTDKEPNKIVTVVCRWFKTYDDAVLVKWRQIRKQQLEAIIVICKLNGPIHWIRQFTVQV